MYSSELQYLCDTNIISELVKKRPDPGVIRWSQHVYAIGISVITVEEIYYGLSWKPNQRVFEWFQKFLSKDIEVLPIDAAIAKHAGTMRGEIQARGESRAQADMLIAASASFYGLTLVTRNSKDFSGCGVALLNPFVEA